MAVIQPLRPFPIGLIPLLNNSHKTSLARRQRQPQHTAINENAARLDKSQINLQTKKQVCIGSIRREKFAHPQRLWWRRRTASGESAIDHPFERQRP